MVFMYIYRAICARITHKKLFSTFFACCTSHFLNILLSPYQGQRYDKKTYGKNHLLSELKNRTVDPLVRFFFFIAPSERTADGDKREESTEAESLAAALFGIANGRMQPKRGTVGEQTALQGERTIGRLNLMEKVNVQTGATICTPSGIPYGFIPMRFDGSHSKGITAPLGRLCKAPPALPDMV